MARERMSVELDDGVLRATRAYAAQRGKSESEVIEEALREHLGFALVERIQEKANLREDEALKLAYEELHAMRAEGRKRPR
jgi:metal-responsive CopG/Arc/MetJ family transcriptional regulator